MAFVYKVLLAKGLTRKFIAEKCPSCGSEYLVEKNLKAGPVIACPNKECDYESAAPPPPEPPAAGATASQP